MKIEKLNFNNGVIPVVTQDTDGKVLMFAYANMDAIKKSVETKNAWYWSRKRNKLWMKGEESGNTQEIIGIYSDCDKDSLLYIVKQIGKACHKGTYSCFDGELFSKKNISNLGDVFKVIKERKKLRPENSYVAGIIDDKVKLIGKIREESEELIEAFSKNDNLVWEAADLIFHTFLLLANKNVEWKDLINEFDKRRKKNE